MNDQRETDISVDELRKLRASTTKFTLLDVRDDDEVAYASLAPALHVPMNEVAERLGELPGDRDIVVMCHVGARSAYVAAFLRRNGFPRAVNLQGGIDAWSCEIDPTVARY